MKDEVLNKNSFLLYFLLLLSGVAYYLLGYHTARQNFLQVFGLFTFLFASFFIGYNLYSATHFKNLFISGIVFRFLLLFSIPNLSEDVFRFIWDGRLAANGINPFSYLPSEIMQMPAIRGISKELYLQLNSVDHYSIYPPVLQGVFWLEAKLFPENVYAAIIFYKCFILFFEIGTFFIMLQVLKKLSLPKTLSLLYILNPLVIIELSGNAHFDGVMIFFVLFAFLLLLKNNWQASGIGLALGIATKLLPVLFLPLLVNKLGWKKGLLYAVTTTVASVILFAVVFDIDTIQHMLNSIDLFIRKFEFNASIYYVVRYFGTLIKGYNIIALAGPSLIMLSTLIIFFISFKRNNASQMLFTKGLFVITTWYFFSTTVHPWYLCLPLAISIFTQYRYAVIWTYLATLSYYAYHSTPVKENLLLTAISYLIVAGYAFSELSKTNIYIKNLSQKNNESI
jgi:hypothetical protein